MSTRFPPGLAINEFLMIWGLFIVGGTACGVVGGGFVSLAVFPLAGLIGFCIGFVAGVPFALLLAAAMRWRVTDATRADRLAFGLLGIVTAAVATLAAQIFLGLWSLTYSDGTFVLGRLVSDAVGVLAASAVGWFIGRAVMACHATLIGGASELDR